MVLKDICLGVSDQGVPISFSYQCDDEDCEKFMKKMKKCYSKWEITNCSDGTWRARFILNNKLHAVVARYNYHFFYLRFQQECSEMNDENDSLETQDFLPEIAKISKDFCDIMEAKGLTKEH